MTKIYYTHKMDLHDKDYSQSKDWIKVMKVEDIKKIFEYYEKRLDEYRNSFYDKYLPLERIF